MLLAFVVAAAAQGGDLAARLAEAVDRPTPGERREAAAALAGEDVSVEAWLEAMRAFGNFAPAEPGTHVETVPLWVGAEELEETALVVHVPPGYDPKTPAPLLLALHGTGGSGRDMVRWWRDVADELGMLVLAPSEAGENEGYAYSDRERLSALSALRWARRRFDVDENRIHLTGISRGGHMAWDLALRFPDRFASLVPMIGAPRLFIAGGQNNLRYLERVARLPVRDLQGAQDDPLLLLNLHLAFERLARWEADAELIEFPELGHEFEFDAVDWAAFFAGAVRDPHPERVVVLATGPARSLWVEVRGVSDEVEEEFVPRVSSAWSSYSQEKQQETLEKMVEARTARLEVERKAPGRFETRASGVESLSLLLLPEDLPDKGPVRVKFSKSHRIEAHPDPRVLLEEFIERFDRTFLPVAEVRVP